MSFQTRNPLRVVGGNPSSGGVNTGQVSTTWGGAQRYTAQSGLGTAVLITAGAGRLDTVTVLNSLQSGQPVLFVDTAVAISGAPLLASNHFAIHTIPAVWREGASGVINPQSAPGFVSTPGVPFFSGLVAAPLASGCPGFTLTYTMDISGSYQPN